MTAPHFIRHPGSTHVLVYAAPHGELLATYWPSEAEARAELPRLRALGVDHMRVESLAELDELEGLS